MNAAFAALFVIMANVAWLTAQATTGPWYNAAVSMQVYSLALGIGTAIVLVVVLVSILRVGSLDARLQRTNERIAASTANLGADRSPASAGATHEEIPEVEMELETLAADGRGALVADKAGHDSLIEVDGLVRVAPSPPRGATLRSLVRERIALRQQRAQVRGYAAGPVLVGLVFLAAAGAMLPGSNGFAATHYQLNTALVLLLSYGLAPLLAWTVIALGLLHARPEAV